MDHREADDHDLHQVEIQLQAIARHYPYPPLPEHPPRPVRWQFDPAGVQRLARVALPLMLAALLLTLAVPDLRAAVVTFLRFGAITVYLEGSDTSGQPIRLDQIVGAMSLTAAQAQVTFPLLIPPDNPPNHVFVQGADLVIMVWVRSGEIERALYQTTGDHWRIVKSTETIVHTEVNTQPAFWVTMTHAVQFLRDGVVQLENTYFVAGNVLGWMQSWNQDEVTYRLETSASLDDARRFAESLVPSQP